MPRRKKNLSKSTPSHPTSQSPSNSSQSSGSQTAGEETAIGNVFTRNSLGTLANISTDEVPPVIVSNKYLLSEVITFLQSGEIEGFLLERTNSGIHIELPTLQLRDKVLNHFESLKIKIRTFVPEIKKFTIKNLITSIPVSDILEGLKQINVLDVRRLYRTDQTGEKIPLNPVIITVPASVTIDQIKAIKHINRCMFTVHEYIPRKDGLDDVIQCFNCHRFGHTKHHCSYIAKCDRCGEEHAMKDCPVIAMAKCTNCNKNNGTLCQLCVIGQKLIIMAQKYREERAANQGSVSPTTTKQYRIATKNASSSSVVQSPSNALAVTTPLPQPAPIPDEVHLSQDLSQLQLRTLENTFEMLLLSMASLTTVVAALSGVIAAIAAVGLKRRGS